MPQSQALIVDDSKTAQFQLQKMLNKYDLEVNTALSAEEALAHLEHHHPNVIFLDHHMQGMDGLSALKIIKENPETAVIPVIMYTSEQGQVYVGQARALGALDILTKGDIHPSTLERVLKNLKIQPLENAELADAANDSNAKQTAAKTSKGKSGKPTPAKSTKPSQTDGIHTSIALGQVRSQLSQQLEQHQAETNNRLAELTEQHKRYIKTSLEESAQQLAIEQQKLFSQTKQRLKLFCGFGLAGLLMVAIAVSLFIHSQFGQLKTDINDTNRSLLAALSHNVPNDSQPSQASPQVAEEQVANQALPVSAINAFFNTDLGFGYREQPLNELQTDKINGLLEALNSINYQGVVNLDLRFGDMCLTPNADNALVLASPQTVFDNCIMLSETAPSFSIDELISIPYVDLQEAAKSLSKGRITLQLSTSGLTTPYMDYPATAATAGEWNNIALQNNRIVVSLSE